MASWLDGPGGPVRVVAAADLRPGFYNDGARDPDPSTSAVPINARYYDGFMRSYNRHAFESGPLGMDRNLADGLQRRYNRGRPPIARPQPSDLYHRTNRLYRSFSGPHKAPQPLYSKRRAPRPVSYHHASHVYVEPQPQPRVAYAADLAAPYYGHGAAFPVLYPPFKYTPTYTSPREDLAALNDSRYPLCVKAMMRILQIVLSGVAILLILAPTLSESVADFLRLTGTEWQAAVLAVLAVLAASALLLLCAALCCAGPRSAWRKADLVAAAMGVALMLACTAVEAYYAACYPPAGPRIDLVCYDADWIVAAALCLLNTFVYVADLCFQLRTGISLL